MDNLETSDATIAARLEQLEREVAALKETTRGAEKDRIELTAQNREYRLVLQMTDYGVLQVYLFTPDANGTWRERTSRTWLYARRQTLPPHDYCLMGG